MESLCAIQRLTALLWGEYRIWFIQVNWLVLPTLMFATSPTGSKIILIQLTLQFQIATLPQILSNGNWSEIFKNYVIYEF